jgi:hypothetical protein
LSLAGDVLQVSCQSAAAPATASGQKFLSLADPSGASAAVMDIVGASPATAEACDDLLCTRRMAFDLGIVAIDFDMRR